MRSVKRTGSRRSAPGSSLTCVANPINAVVEQRHPEVPLRVFGDVSQRRQRRGKALNSVVHDTNQQLPAAPGVTQPHVAVPVLVGHVVDGSGTEPAEVVRSGHSVLESPQPLAVREPQPAVSVAQDEIVAVGDSLNGHEHKPAVFVAVVLVGGRVIATAALIGTEDHAAIRVRKETRAQIRRDLHFPGLHGDAEAPVLVRKDLPFLGAHPDSSAAVGEGSRHPVVGDRRGVAPIEHREPDAVEAHQPFLSSQPHVTVRRLGQGGHRVLRKSVVGRPRIHARLGLEGHRDEAQHGDTAE